MFKNHLVNKSSNGPYMMTSYPQEMVISAFNTPWRKKWMVLGIIVFVIIPFLCPIYFLHIFNLIAIACMGAMALNLVTGTAGLLSLGHAGFMCAGAFTAGILASRFGMPMWVTIPSTLIIGGILGFISGLPSLRLRGLYLGISTLGMHYIIIYLSSEYQFIVGSGQVIHIENPLNGLVNLPKEKLWYFFLWFIVWGVGLFIKNLLRSRPGRAWTALRDRDIAARVMGIRIGWYRIGAFIVGTAITSLSGGLYAYYSSIVAVEEYTFYLTISYVAMIIIGGVGAILGSIMGAFLITLIPYLLLYLFGMVGGSFFLKDYFYALESGIFGLLIVFFLLVEPLGLIEIWRRIRVYFEFWPFKNKPLMITKR